MLVRPKVTPEPLLVRTGPKQIRRVISSGVRRVPLAARTPITLAAVLIVLAALVRCRS
jgi:hypothetical protein